MIILNESSLLCLYAHSGSEDLKWFTLQHVYTFRLFKEGNMGFI